MYVSVSEDGLGRLREAEFDRVYRHGWEAADRLESPTALQLRLFQTLFAISYRDSR